MMNAFALEECIDAYELALLEGRAAIETLEQFLPEEEEAGRRETLVELLRITLEHDWLAGDKHSIEPWRARFAALFADPAALNPLAYEEYRLRREDGQPATRLEYADRYGVDVSAWRELTPVSDEPAPSESQLWQEFSLSEPATAARMAVSRRQFPEVGERFGPFQTLALLGEGAFGKVFLAQQKSLANRLVALKVSAGPPIEANRLARMQHSNIVPVYSVHRRGRLAGVCMPYLGGVTLADLFRRTSEPAKSVCSTHDLLSTVEARQAELSTILDQPEVAALVKSDHTASPAMHWSRYRLEEAIVWIVARIAAGLAHAHSRGILHRDLKPANILISDDGEPLILDFNLAQEAGEAEAHVARLGGTLPYMSPEQLEQFQTGRQIDVQSDVYSLGVILYQGLTGELPFPYRNGSIADVLAQMIHDRRGLPAQTPRSQNSAVSPGLEAIVLKCLAPEPHARYATAANLQEDLERHLESQPLKFAPNISLPERATKWVRRHPRLSSATSVTLIAVVFAAIASGAWLVREQKFAQKGALEKWRQFTEQAAQTRSLISLRLVDPMLNVSAADAANEVLGRYAVLEQPQWHQAKEVRNLPKTERSRMAGEVSELLLLLARLQQQANQPAVAPPTLSAEELRSRAEDAWVKLTGQTGLPSADSSAGTSDDLDPAALTLGLRLSATNELEHGRYREARSIARQLAKQQPQDISAWLLLGIGALEEGNFVNAESAFNTCVILYPDFYLGYEYRGLARLNSKRWPQAEEDFSQVLNLRPDRISAAFNRALARQGLGEHRAAIDDITKALEGGLTETRAYFQRAISYAALGDKEHAVADREMGLNLEPTDVLSWIERGLAQLPANPNQAEHDLLEAVRLGKNSRYSRLALMNLAHVQSERLGKNAEAVEHLSRLLERNAEDQLARGSRAVLQARLGQTQPALDDLAALFRTKTDTFALYQVACTYALLARNDQAEYRVQAMQRLQDAIGLNPAFKQVAATDADLKNLREDATFQRLVGTSKETE